MVINLQYFLFYYDYAPGTLIFGSAISFRAGEVLVQSEWHQSRRTSTWQHNKGEHCKNLFGLVMVEDTHYQVYFPMVRGVPSAPGSIGFSAGLIKIYGHLCRFTTLSYNRFTTGTPITFQKCVTVSFQLVDSVVSQSIISQHNDLLTIIKYSLTQL